MTQGIYPIFLTSLSGHLLAISVLMQVSAKQTISSTMVQIAGDVTPCLRLLGESVVQCSPAPLKVMDSILVKQDITIDGTLNIISVYIEQCL